MGMRHVELITTGGTIEKTYDERDQELTNRGSVVQRMLRRLKIVGTEVHHRPLMSKDSLHLTDHDRSIIVKAVRNASELSNAVVVLHGTDTLSVTGDLLVKELGTPRVPVILTGAWRPYEMVRTDALQNLTEALLASSLLPPGVWCVAHGRALAFPGVVKNRELGTFEKPA